MSYVVVVRKKAIQNARLLPDKAKMVLKSLLKDLENGPVQSRYPHFGKLAGKNEYHCHLAYRWVATWRCEEDRLLVEVEYVGSRESAPYAKH